jgi:hypothetical protein
MNKLKKLGFKKVPGTAPGFHMYELTPAKLQAKDSMKTLSHKLQATSHKLQAASDKHLTNLDKGLYRMYESKRSR